MRTLQAFAVPKKPLSHAILTASALQHLIDQAVMGTLPRDPQRIPKDLEEHLRRFYDVNEVVFRVLVEELSEGRVCWSVHAEWGGLHLESPLRNVRVRRW